MKRGVLARWAAHLPLTARTPQLTLGEGDTPLIAAPTLARDIGCAELWLKFEGQNPTGSFKDRGMVVAVAKAVEAGAHSAVCASTGNTSASAAAYCAAAGVRCNVVVPEGKVALGKLAQAVAHGARILVLRGNFDAALSRVREIAQRTGIALLNSVNPHRIEGQKTAAFELAEALGEVPHAVALPVGNAGNITAYWRGFCELGPRRPVMLGFQATGAAPLVSGTPVAEPETIATAIRIGNPASWKTAVEAQRDSGGLFAAVTDAEILAAYRRLSSEAGVFCEPASAAPVAGLLRLAQEKRSFAGQTIVAVLTGHGLKDPQAAIDAAAEIGPAIADDISTLEAALQ
ncbi:MAG: threonine synthase [Deltaproteobacteria bacterium]|nr:MAG: threonine synthase [Deltaproteobacteria bacterium]